MRQVFGKDSFAPAGRFARRVRDAHNPARPDLLPPPGQRGVHLARPEDTQGHRRSGYVWGRPGLHAARVGETGDI